MFIKAKKMLPIVIAGLLALHGCGGGSSSAPPNNGGNPPPPPPTGGITRTGVAIAVGPITTFGSVVVNGVRYDTSSATFTKDGVESSQAEMSVGEFVVVTGTIDDDNSNAVATTVEYESVLEGPIGSITTNGFVAVGQTVVVSLGSTSVDDSCPDPLVTGVNVEVSGSILENGDINASRVECKAVLLEMEVQGRVKVGSVTTTTFQINALTVDFSTITPRNFPGGAISDGDPVEVKGITLVDGPPLTLTATDVEFKGPRFGDDEGDHVEVEGFIANFESATEFTVSPFEVTTDDNTTYEPADMGASDLGPNLKVEVEGEIDGDGFLLATKIKFKQATNVRVVGLVDFVERTPNTLEILGITISTVPGETRFEDKYDPPGGAREEILEIGELRINDYVEVRGQEFPAGSDIVAAVILERDDPPAVLGEEETILRGFVEPDPTSVTGDIVRPNLIVLGVTIRADDAITEYFDDRGSNEDVPMDPDEFWVEVAVGSLVKAKGIKEDVKAMFAEELELKD